MQRIIGYECFLENTFRALCEQLNVPSKMALKFNNQFVSDAMSTTPIGKLLAYDFSNNVVSLREYCLLISTLINLFE